MTDQPAAIQATFSDFRIVKGRKVAQLVLEIPLEQADAALSTLGGIPQPQSERWVAIARLNPNGPIYEGMDKDEFNRKMQGQPEPGYRNGDVWVEGENSYQYQNGDWVPNNPRQKGQYPTAAPEPKPDKERQRWEDLNLAMQAGMRCNEVAFRQFLTETETSAFEARSVQDAEEMVRQRCEVDSRKELNLDPTAARRWREIDRSYQAWLKAAE